MNELLSQGLAVMCIGMGTVIAFLCITIGSMFAMSAIVRKLNQIFPEAVPAMAGPKKAISSSNEDESIAVAILSAILKK